MIKEMYNKKIWLIILDWFWINEKIENNAIKLANAPLFEKLFSNNYTKLEASETPVWLPKWQMWNSEVWHLTIWAWRVLKQSLVEIDDLFEKKQFEELEEFKNWISHCVKNNSSLHLFTLFWDWWVHAHINHLEQILKIIPNSINVKLHLFWDWRDLPQTSMLEQFEKFLENIKDYKNIEINSISGRFFAMDRDNNWDRVKTVYDILCSDTTAKNITPSEYIKNSYTGWIYDEFLEPINFTWNIIKDNDAIFHLNFRSDRAVQLTKTFHEKELEFFERKNLKNLYICTMTKYYKAYDWHVFIKEMDINNTIWEVISKNWLKQLHLAETEKFSHVTKFFNWWKQVVFSLEEDILIASKKVKTYDLDPTMSAYEIAETYIEKCIDFDFSVINFANWDMVWHTWNLEASIKAVEVLDEVLTKIIDKCTEENIEIYITADHWNCECMFDEKWEIVTSHTVNQVPFWYISKWEFVELKEKYWTLADIAPTILNNFWIEIPSEMSWKILS